jgi:hypothetical protein
MVAVNDFIPLIHKHRVSRIEAAAIDGFDQHDKAVEAKPEERATAVCVVRKAVVERTGLERLADRCAIPLRGQLADACELPARRVILRLHHAS